MKENLSTEFAHLGKFFSELFGAESKEDVYIGYPYIDIYLLDYKLHFEVAVAGFPKENLKVTINEGKLIIEGNKKHCNIADFNEDRYVFLGTIARRAFKRSFDVPPQCDAESCETSLDNGILSIVFCVNKVEHKVLEIK